MLEQPGSETREHNVVAICELRHANVDKQRTLLAFVDVTPPRNAAYDHMIFQCFALREMLVSH